MGRKAPLMPSLLKTAKTFEISIDYHENKNSRQKLILEEEEIEFAAVGTGSQGEGVNYHFVLEFFLPVKKDSGLTFCNYKVFLVLTYL